MLQGIPGAYSESAARKAYPKCETVPCEEFEAAFKVQLFFLHNLLLLNHYTIDGHLCSVNSI